MAVNDGEEGWDRPDEGARVESDDFAEPIIEPAKWPVVIGVISIVWASLSLLCGGVGMALIPLQDRLVRAAAGQTGPFPDVMKPGPGMIAVGLVGLALAIVLLVAGILAVQRRPAARALHLLYALLGIANSFTYMALSLQQQTRIEQWVQANPDDFWASQYNPATAVVSLVIAMAFGLAWPVFCLLWFGLVRRRAADIAAGVEPPAA